MSNRLLGRCLVASVVLLGATAAVRSQDQVEGLPARVRQELAPAATPLPAGRYTLCHTWKAGANELKHQAGQAVTDADAVDGTAWEGRALGGSGLPPKTPVAEPVRPTHGCLVYGPYIELAPGDYLALFRLRLVGPSEFEDLGQMDACVHFGQELLAHRDLTASLLGQDRYVQVPLVFHYADGRLECRVQWNGTATLRVDQVTLYRLEGARLTPDQGMVPQPKPSGQPRDLPYPGPQRTLASLFPRSAPPDGELLVADLRPLPPDWRLCVLCLQGLVNREKPRLYCLIEGQDAEWLDWLTSQGWVKSTRPAPPADELVARYRDLVKGVVIEDAKLPATRNVATMLAGVETALAVSPRIARHLGLPVLADLRGRWTTHVEAYRWAFTELWPRLNQTLAACLWPEHLPLRDYLVQHRVPVFWLPGRIDGSRPGSRPAEEVQLVEELLAKLPPNTPLLGYPWAGKDMGLGEGPGVTLFAEFAKYLVGSVGSSNLSVHSGVRPGALAPPAAPPLPELDRSKVHVGVVISDGDNLPVLTVHNFPQLWKDPLRGQIPLGWTLSPAAGCLVPDVVRYYYASATPQDCFLGAVSGIGYTYADSYAERFRGADRDAVFGEFLALTDAGMRSLALRHIWIMNASRPALIRRYAEGLPQIEGMFPDYGCRVTSYADATYPTARNVAVFHAATSWIDGAPRPEQVAKIVSGIQALTPTERPAFLHLFIWNWGFDLGMIQDVLTQLGPEYVAVRPDHLAGLYRAEIERRQVLSRLPAQVVGIEGLALAFAGRLHNATAGPIELATQVRSGLTQARVTPARGSVASGADVELQVVGTPAAGSSSIVLAWTGTAAEQQAQVAFRLIPRTEFAPGLPAEVQGLRSVARFEAVALSHREGVAAADPAALAGRAWTATVGQQQPGHIAFGPYSPLPAGRYLAAFRLRRLDDTTAGPLVTVDTCVAGGTPTTGMLAVTAETLPTRDYHSVPVVFEHPGGNVETRVYWPGRVSVAVDSVLLWAIEPGAR